MKCVVIAAGYAMRLYPLTENFPKPLLMVGSKSILERIFDDIDTIPDIDESIIVTNHKFYDFFERWRGSMKHYVKPMSILDDGTTCNETRLGAVRDLLLAIETFGIDDDIFVLAADNVVDFSFQGFVEFFRQKQTSTIMCYHESEMERLKRTGVIAVDDHWRVLQMQEKPQMPLSNWAVPPFYIYKRSDLPLIRDCIRNGCGFDAPGNLANYLVSKAEIHAWKMPGKRFDIGSLDCLREVQCAFGQNNA